MRRSDPSSPDRRRSPKMIPIGIENTTATTDARTLNGHCNTGYSIDDLCHSDSGCDAEHASDARQYCRFRQELGKNRPLRRADRFLQSDLTRPLGNGYKHDIHNTDTTDQKRNTSQSRSADCLSQSLDPASFSPARADCPLYI